MDPNLPPTPPSQVQPNPPGKRNTIMAITIIIVTLIAAAALIYSQNLFKKPPTKPQEVTKPVPTQAPPKLQTPKGTIVSLTTNSLILKPESTGAANLTFTITDNAQIQRLTAGTIEGPGTKLIKAALSDLKVGQKVYIIANSKNEATTVVILK